MGITIESDPDPETWNELVERSEQTCPFHQYESLCIQADHSSGTVHPLVGYKGEEPIGLFPVFELSRGPVQLAFSPPPALRIAYLGPALLERNGLKQRKRERRLHDFVEQCLEWTESTFNPRYGHMRLHGSFEDLRPFIWNDCTVRPSYTYLVDLDTDEDDLLMSFSRDARSNIRDNEAQLSSVREGTVDDLEQIVEQVAARYARQGIEFAITPEFVTTLATELPDGAVRPYVLEVDGSFEGGVVVLDDGSTVYRWQGGVRTDSDTDLPSNDLLDWQIMADAIDRGRTGYDLVGADNRRINRYKAKFNPDLEPFYSIEQGSPITTALARGYRWLQGRT